MQTLWFILVALMLTMYVLLDGFDLGAGIIHLIAARNDNERRLILRAIGPVWDGNEVWLIAAGGVLFAVFPVLYASSFSGFYLPLIFVLWLLMIRGAAIEMRNIIQHQIWGTFWDGLFFLGSSLLAIFYGAAMANVIRGVPLDSKGTFFEPLWTDFNPFSKNPGILDWYTILIGLLAFTTLTAHGASFIAIKTDGVLNLRSRIIAMIAWITTIILTILGTIATFAVQPVMSQSFFAQPIGFIFPIIAFIGLASIGYCLFKRLDKPLFLSSCAFIAGMLASVAFGLYPNVLPAVDPANSLTIQNASASQYSQTAGLVWWCIGIVLAAIYFIVTYRLFRGKVTMEKAGGY